MARYILVVIEDNVEADLFVKSLENRTVIFERSRLTNEERDVEVSYAHLQGATVRAVWMKPTKFCECAKPGNRSVRGEKYGLYVHLDCKRPKRGAWQHPRNLHSSVPSAAAMSEHLHAAEPANLKPGERDIYLGVLEPQPADGVTSAPVGAPYRNRL
jgi:hypothetical protein